MEFFNKYLLLLINIILFGIKINNLDASIKENLVVISGDWPKLELNPLASCTFDIRKTSCFQQLS